MTTTNKNRARQLRKNPTDVERFLWLRLQKRQIAGCKFRRQQPLGPYIVDFVCFETRVIIEVDGGQHSERRKYDSARGHWLESQGFRVLRFWNNQVLGEIEAVLEVIAKACSTPAPSLPGKGGGGVGR